MMEYQHVPVTICFNKCDLVTEEEQNRLRAIYEPAGYPMLFTSAKNDVHVDRLRELLADKTTAVAGPSGVGKSSLVNRLQNDVQMETGSISDKIGRGNEIWQNGIKRQLLLLCCIIKQRIYDFTSRKTVRHAG